MNFVSIDFLYFFMAVFPTYFLLPDRWRNIFLLLASYFFYAFWSVKYLCLLVFTMALDYFVAIGIDSARTERNRKYFLTFSIVANLGILFIFKYFNLFSGVVASITGRSTPMLSLVLPFGISFYTFHAMSYTIDVYRKTIPVERNFIYYSGYVMFFPQLVAGPIARASHLLHQFSEKKVFRIENLKAGSWLILRGYVLKVVLADHLGAYVDAYFGTDVIKTPFLVTQAIYFFAFQIYFDFSGYTDMARGIARLMDFDLVVNFNRPYVATSITDFWRRWHISLSTWLRDYLYISLGGNRHGSWKTYRNLMLTMLLGGLWHGAHFTFLVWGGLHGLYLVAEKALGNTWIGRVCKKIPTPIRIVAVFHLALLAWIFFRASDFRQAFDYTRQLGHTLVHASEWKRLEFQKRLWVMILVWMGFEAVEARLELSVRHARSHWAFQFALIYAGILLVALFSEINPKAFIYFQF